jgi:bifunctional non-homologous end joining protein LigD
MFGLPLIAVPAREDPPRFISPMLASTGPIPDAEGWAVEVKWDGIRAQVRVDHGRLCVRSRPGRDCTTQFPELEALAGPFRTRQVILDGEIVCLGDDGAPRFDPLRARLGRGRPPHGCRAATFMAFDVLHLDGEAVRTLPYARRRELLDELDLEGDHWRTPRHWASHVHEVAEVTRARCLEGVVMKRLDASYAAGRRSNAWIKLKHRRREVLDVVAWRPANDRQPEEFLLSRMMNDGTTVPAGSVSFGLAPDERDDLRATLAARAHRARRRNQRLRWVQPGIRVEVDHHGQPDGTVRDAILRSFTAD